MRYLAIGALVLAILTSSASATQDPRTAGDAASARVVEIVRELSGRCDRDDHGRLYWIVLEGDGVNTEVIRTLSKCRFLKTLTLGSRLTGDVDLSPLSNLTLLESLTIRSHLVRDSDLAFLSGLKNLTYLDLSDTAVTGTALEWLPSPDRVQAVTLRRCRSFVNSGRFLEKATALQFVDFSGTSASGKALLGLKHARDLRHAELPDTGADDELLASLPTRELRVLDIKGTKVSDDGVKALAVCRKLRILDLSSTRISDEAVSQLGALRELTTLNLSRTGAGDRGLQAVGRNLQLSDLRLANTLVTDAGLVQLKGLVSLATLDVSGTGITDVGITSLNAMHELVSLDISGTRTGGEPTLDTIKLLASLRSLKAARTKLDDRGLGVIAKLEAMHTLDLSKTAVTDAGVKLLGGHRSLRTLYLTDTRVGDSGAEALPECQELINLGLGNTRITDGTLIRLRSHFLKFLDVSGTTITSRGILALIDLPIADVQVIDITNTQVRLPKRFRPPVRENGRVVLRNPFNDEVENVDWESGWLAPRRSSGERYTAKSEDTH